MDIPLLSVAMDNQIKCQWVFTKLGMCIDIVKVWFGMVWDCNWANFHDLFYRLGIIVSKFYFSMKTYVVGTH